MWCCGKRDWSHLHPVIHPWHNINTPITLCKKSDFTKPGKQKRNNSRSQCSLLELINNFRMADFTSSWHPIGSKVHEITSSVLSHGLTDLMWLEERKKKPTTTHYALKTQMQWLALSPLHHMAEAIICVCKSPPVGEKRKKKWLYDFFYTLSCTVNRKTKEAI